MVDDKREIEYNNSAASQFDLFMSIKANTNWNTLLSTTAFVPSC